MMFVLPRIFGLNGVWFAQPTADLISFIITLIVISKEIKSHKVSTTDNTEESIAATKEA